MPPSMRLQAVLSAILAVSVFSGLDALIKAASIGTPLALVVFLRYAAGSVFAVGSAGLQHQLRIGWPTIRRALARSTANLATAVLFFGALKLMPLAQTVALTFTSPFFMVLISSVMLGDPITRRSMIATAIGFLGVVVMLAEKFASDAGSPLGFGLALASALAYAFSIILSRRDTAHDSVPQMIVAQNLIVTFVTLPFAVYSYQPVSGVTLLLFVVIGAFGTVGQSAMAWAYKHAPATQLGPLEFTSLIWAVTFGFVFFSETPSVYTLVGAAIIIAACLTVIQPAAKPSSGSL